jgi:hypothetical protein
MQHSRHNVVTKEPQIPADSKLHASTYRYIPVHTSTYQYIPVYTRLYASTYRYIPVHTSTYLYILGMSYIY